jgi:hypothetical protein
MFKRDDDSPRLRRPGFPSWSWAGWQETEENYNRKGACLDYDLYGTYISPDKDPKKTIHSEKAAIYSEVDWHHVRESKYQKLDNHGVPNASKSTEGFQAARRSWKHFWFETLSLPPLPPGLITEEEGQLLVFQTSCAFLYVDWPSDSNSATPFQPTGRSLPSRNWEVQSI